jgi:hypothetical protein
MVLKKRKGCRYSTGVAIVCHIFSVAEFSFYGIAETARLSGGGFDFAVTPLLCLLLVPRLLLARLPIRNAPETPVFAPYGSKMANNGLYGLCA